MLIEDEHLEGKWNRLSLWTVMYVVFLWKFLIYYYCAITVLHIYTNHNLASV